MRTSSYVPLLFSAPYRRKYATVVPGEDLLSRDDLRRTDEAMTEPQVRVMSTLRLFVSALLLGGCATATVSNENSPEPSPSGSATGGHDVAGGGGASTVGGQPPATGGGAVAGHGGGTASVCGDGVLDSSEECDGDNFGTSTCETFGLISGTLYCSSDCIVMLSYCDPSEICDNGYDDDNDQLVDCLDPDCATAPVCVDPCYSPQPVTLPFNGTQDSTGAADVLASGCSAASGPELIYEIVADFTGQLGLTIPLPGWHFTVSVRTLCDDSSSELGCNRGGGAQPAKLSVPVVQGNTYYIIVDGYGSADAGTFTLIAEQITTETRCNDFADDDFDGYVDCDDSDCHGQTDCVPGTTNIGQPCFSNGQCKASNNDPICLSDYWFPNHYCSEFCNLSTNDCTGDGVCADLGWSTNGVCLDGCVTSADCANGYFCKNLGLSSNVCFVASEMSCYGNWDEDLDGLIDCEDPDCKYQYDCMPGTGAPGAPCFGNWECAANNNDPHCFGLWPGGYCSELCNLIVDDCPAGSACVDYLNRPSGNGQCMKTCATVSDCDAGYQCHDFGNGTKVCVW